MKYPLNPRSSQLQHPFERLEYSQKHSPTPITNGKPPCGKFTIETSFGTLEYAVKGEGEPILVVHGAGGGFDQALNMTGAMAGHGYRLIAPSRFG